MRAGHRTWPATRRSASAGRARRGARRSARTPAARPGQATRASSKITIAAKPAVSTGTSAFRPGWGSARRAGPIGISGEAAKATAQASTAPAAAATPTSIRPAVSPSAARVPLSLAAAKTVAACAASSATKIWPPVAG
ncbi:MAG TPA: hypothetical protein VH480_10860 [Streptosporangiaceae bacterium]